MLLSGSGRSANLITAVTYVPSELDLNRLDGDSVCPPMRSGQDDLPGKDRQLKPTESRPDGGGTFNCPTAACE